MTTWDDKPNDYEHAVRLLETIRSETVEQCARVADEMIALHNATIEECAKLVEGWSVPWQMVPSIAELAAAIRALKGRE